MGCGGRSWNLLIVTKAQLIWDKLLTIHLDVAALLVLRLRRGSAPLCCLLLLLCRSSGCRFLLQLLLLEPGFGYWKEEGTFKRVLFTVLAYWRISVRQDVASMKIYPVSRSGCPGSRGGLYEGRARVGETGSRMNIWNW